MYNHKHIATFINKVNKEAEKAAQLIFNRHTQQLKDLVRNQLQVGEELICINGYTMFRDDIHSDKADELRWLLSDCQYHKVDAGFLLDSIKREGEKSVKSEPLIKVRLGKEIYNSLDTDGKAVFYLNERIPCPKSSIIYGEGKDHLWDKIDRIWVYGDCNQYIKDKMNVGRRATDYPDNSINTWSGKHWYDLYTSVPKDIKIDSKINGVYTVTDIKISQIFPKIKYSITISA